MAAMQADLDRRVRDRPDPQVSMVGQVYDAGDIPTEVPAYFAVHPVTVGGVEAENEGVTFDVSTGTSHFAVIGSTVPAVGDYLIADAIDGRWVAGYQKSEASCVAECPLPPTSANILCTVHYDNAIVESFELAWTSDDPIMNEQPGSPGGWMSTCVESHLGGVCYPVVQIRFFCWYSLFGGYAGWNAQGFIGGVDCELITGEHLGTCSGVGNLDRFGVGGSRFGDAELQEVTCDPIYYHFRVLTAAQGMASVYFTEAP
jgi:hypothetical protein